MYADLTSLPVENLESLLEEFPWFTLARKEYLWRQVQMGEDALRSAVAASALYLPSRAGFLREVEQRVRREAEGKRDDAARHAEAGRQSSPARAQIYVVGGDYFDRSEYELLEEKGLAVDTSSLAFNPIASALGTIGQEVVSELPLQRKQEFSDDDFCTETLARIYFDQAFYQKAIETYEKLILRYPKKSAYFAALIDKAKNIKTS